MQPKRINEEHNLEYFVHLSVIDAFNESVYDFKKVVAKKWLNELLRNYVQTE